MKCDISSPCIIFINGIRRNNLKNTSMEIKNVRMEFCNLLNEAQKYINTIVH